MPTRDSHNTWLRFIYDVAGDDSQATIARKTGIDQGTISRWRSGERRPNPEKVIRFARGYGVNPVTALVAIGLISEDEANMPRTAIPDLAAVPTGRLIAELAHRDTAEAAS